MKRSAYFVLVFAGVLFLLPRCVSTPPGITVTSRAPRDSTKAAGQVEPTHAWIFIDGTQQGATPATVILRRDFGVNELSLHVGSKFKQVRRYEIERVVTSSRRDLDYSFNGSSEGGTVTFNARELSQDKDGTFVIPYFSYPIQIVDNEYDLTLIVKD